MKIERQKYTMEEIEKFGEFFTSGHTLQETADQFGVKYSTIKTYMTKFGYRIPNRKMLNKEENVVNSDYFENIDTHEKAYFLGLLLADGYLTKSTYSYIVGIALQSCDKYILEYLKNELGTNSNISEYKNSHKLPISNEKLYNDLNNLGMYEGKSHKDYDMPNIGSEFINSFILGYFDGDGCITIKSSGAIVVSICCNSEVFLDQMKNTLLVHGIKTRVTCEKGERLNPLYILYLCGRENQLKFKNFIYSSSKIYLKRKFDKFQKIPS